MTTEFEAARRQMVDCQIRTTNVTAPRVLEAFMEVPREEFVPAAMRDLAYIDDEIELAKGRFLAAPAKLARLVQAAAVKSGDVVLDVGCGSGYSTAILARLASSVVALEENAELAFRANVMLGALNVSNAAVVTGPLRDGVAREAPFDVILLAGSVADAPQALLDQLRDGGRLVAVQGTGAAARAFIHVRDGDDVAPRPLFNCALPPLPGFERKAEFVF